MGRPKTVNSHLQITIFPRRVPWIRCTEHPTVEGELRTNPHTPGAKHSKVPKFVGENPFFGSEHANNVMFIDCSRIMRFFQIFSMFFPWKRTSLSRLMSFVPCFESVAVSRSMSGAQQLLHRKKGFALDQRRFATSGCDGCDLFPVVTMHKETPKKDQKGWCSVQYQTWMEIVICFIFLHLHHGAWTFSPSLSDALAEGCSTHLFLEAWKLWRNVKECEGNLGYDDQDAMLPSRNLAGTV